MRCAIVDALGIGRFLPGALSRHGIQSIHVRSEFPDRYASYKPDDNSIQIQHRGDLAATARFLRQHGVDFVIAGHESGVLLTDSLSAELGTPGHGMNRPDARRDKFQMVLAVREAGLATARSFSSPSADELGAWALNLGEWPVVIKPVASAGTENVFFCDSIEALRSAHATIMAADNRFGLRNQTVLAQQYLSGDEYFINTISRDGVHHIVEVWQYHKRTLPDGRPIYDYEHPILPGDPAVRSLSDYTCSVLDALEVRNGAAHTEVMMTKAGPILVESGARLGGSHLPEVVSRCLGTNQVEQLALAIARPEELTQKRIPPYQLLTHLRYVTLINPQDGVVPAPERFAKVRSLDSFLDMVLTTPAGEPAPRTVDLATSPGYVYLSATDPAQIDADYRRLREMEENGLYEPA